MLWWELIQDVQLKLMLLWWLIKKSTILTTDERFFENLILIVVWVGVTSQNEFKSEWCTHRNLRHHNYKIRDFEMLTPGQRANKTVNKQFKPKIDCMFQFSEYLILYTLQKTRKRDSYSVVFQRIPFNNAMLAFLYYLPCEWIGLLIFYKMGDELHVYLCLSAFPSWHLS